MDHEYIIHLVNPSSRPPFYLVADRLWGIGCNIDSDGDSIVPEDTEWTELYLRLRGGSEFDEVNIGPISDNPLILAVRSPSKFLCENTAAFLQTISGGSIEKIA
ncbi:hypothetical protein [Undibacterium macrobrachii]|uniref:Uncharacterized protein n=1 Tax=Undibacterium macrobrachii TaxID=1119058 RepID=A0ABQ2XHV0_9BURK|nr:hypothetical protein [Undibacterium macrobrachii]GGX17590.1 hypothetical protein GCM10011282_24580 [Undibacterium macrobrachii]